MLAPARWAYDVAGGICTGAVSRFQSLFRDHLPDNLAGPPASLPAARAVCSTSSSCKRESSNPLESGAMGLFGNKEKRAAQEEAGRVEVERLSSLTTAELAAEVMPAFAPDRAKAKGRSGTAARQVIQWLMAGYARHPSLRPLADRVPVALQRLAAAGLLRAASSGIGTGVQSYSLTPDGEAAMAEGSVAQRLGDY